MSVLLLQPLPCSWKRNGVMSIREKQEWVWEMWLCWGWGWDEVQGLSHAELSRGIWGVLSSWCSKMLVIGFFCQLLHLESVHLWMFVWRRGWSRREPWLVAPGSKTTQGLLVKPPPGRHSPFPTALLVPQPHSMLRDVILGRNCC